MSNRPAPRRSSLAGATPTTPPAAPDPAPPTPDGAATAGKAKKASTAKTTRPKAQKAPSGATARLGVYLTPEEFVAAKGAYLADWDNGGEVDNFARWITAAIDTYAARTPKQRSTAEPRGRAKERTGFTRSFAVPVETVARMRAAISDDQHAGRWPSDSAWCGEAIAYSVDQARTRNGGTLPTPPDRLPTRLVRAQPVSDQTDTADQTGDN